MTRAALDADLAVVGFGPVGATLSGLAARHGLRVIALDREIDLFPLPRAAHCDHEVLRILQELGCADEIVASMCANAGMDFLTADREVLLRFDSPGLAPSGWPASVLFHQPGFEAALRRAVAATTADVRLGVGVAEVVDHGDHVAVHTDDGATLRVAHVVACDGARSGVRKALGVELDDLDFEEPWLVVDLVLQAAIPALPDRCYQVCDPARPHTLVPMPWPRFRFEFMLLPGEDPETIQQPEQVDALLSAWIDPALVTVERGAVYTFHGLVAKQWRVGRVLLAGDAAHQMPPFLGQGMCSGLRDAANLAWKLAAIARGDADEDLLDTYQVEREPHVRAIVEAAVGFGRLICTTDPDVATARDAQMLANRVESQQPPELAARLGASAALGTDGGGLAPQPIVANQRLDDLVGPRWLLVVRDPDAAGVPTTSTHLLVLGAADLGDAEPMLRGGDAVLVRPDRHVHSRGSEAIAAAARLP